MKKIIITSIVVFLFISMCLTAPIFQESNESETFLVKVTAEEGNIRKAPDLSSLLLTQLPKGTILEVNDNIGSWYSIDLPPDEEGKIVSGYIHSSMVEIVGGTDQSEPSAPEYQPVVVKPDQISHPAAPQTKFSLTPEKFLSGFFVRFGVLFQPTPGDFRKSWIGSLGYDFSLGKSFSLGVEIQPAYHNYESLNFLSIPIVGYVNLKGGASFSSVAIFAGGGFGAEIAFDRIELEGEKITDTAAYIAYHALAGFEFSVGPVAFMIEYQLNQVMYPDTDTFWRHYILAGIRF